MVPHCFKDNADGKENKMLTIFTPTYNRAYIIKKLYQSLKNQTSEDFEWIVVDDDSTDNTEDLFRSFGTVGKGITYIKQPHGGKHRAINRALKIARGDYFFIVDSDDFLTNDAVEKVNSWTENIDKDDICGVAGLKCSTQGNIWGGTPSISANEYVEATNIEREKYELLGDKAEVYSTQIMKEHPFPEYEHEYFVTEAVVWDWIALDGCKLRWYNEPIYVCEYLENGLTKNDANGRKGHVANPRGFARYVETEIRAYGFDKTWELFVEYLKVSGICHIQISQKIRDLNITSKTYAKYYVISFIRRCKRKICKLKKES